VWEILGAAQKEKEMTILLGKSEQADFLDHLLNHYDEIMAAFSRIDARKAEAHFADDLRMIVDAVKKSPGYPVVNELLLGQLRRWFVSTGTKEVRALQLEQGDSEDVATGLHNLGSLLQDQGKLDEAKEQGKLDEAKLMMEESLTIRRKIFGDKSSQVAESLNNLGLLLQKQGELDEAKLMMEKSLAINKSLDEQ
jgi:tetratricopeptide (TPR) repeat protein